MYMLYFISRIGRVLDLVVHCILVTKEFIVIFAL